MLKASQSLLLFRAFVFQGAAAVTAREPYVSYLTRANRVQD